MKITQPQIRNVAFICGVAITISSLFAMNSPIAWMIFGLGVCGLSLFAAWRAGE